MQRTPGYITYCEILVGPIASHSMEKERIRDAFELADFWQPGMVKVSRRIRVRSRNAARWAGDQSAGLPKSSLYLGCQSDPVHDNIFSGSIATRTLGIDFVFS